MRVLFLDFDGVLNSLPVFRLHRRWWRRLRMPARLPAERRVIHHRLSIGRAHVRVLNRIIAATGAVVVVSSSWRHGASVEELAELLRSRGFRGRVIDKTLDINLNGYIDAVVGEPYLRGGEIARWIADHPGRIEGIAILDDDCDMGALRPWLVKTDTFVGLRGEHVERVVAKLRGSMEWAERANNDAPAGAGG